VSTLVVTEAELAAQVRQLATLFGWRRYHTFLAKHSAAGFPDEVLVRGPRLLFAELKSEKGVLKEPQRDWLEALAHVETVDVRVWRPADLEQIAETLR
jgi:hypothetical protein